MADRVLLVAPPGSPRAGLERALRRPGFDVDSADDVEAALASLSSPATVVVVAVGAGDDTTQALSFIRTVRGRPDTAAVAIVGVGWQRRPHLAEQVLEAGADDYVVAAVGSGDAAEGSELEARVLAQLRARRRPRHSVAAEVQARADAITIIEALLDGNRGATPLQVPESSVEAVAAACRTALSLRGVMGASVVALDDPSKATVVASAGRAPIPLESGSAFDPGTALALWRRAAEGPWFQPSMSEPGWLAVAPIASDEAAAVFAVWFTPTAVADDDQRAVALATAMDIAAALRPLVAPLLAGRHERARRRLAVDDVIADNAFTPVFQPIFAIGPDDEERVIGHEALTRFHDDTPPDRRFAAASYVGRREKLELAAVEAAVTRARFLPAGGWLSVNLSAATIVARHEVLARQFEKSDRPIVVEITEHEPIGDYPTLRAAMAAIEQRPAVCVDDAGSGYASLQHVAALEPEYIKLDRSWVRGLARDRVRQAIVAGMREFAVRAGVELIAEGVEESSELSALQSLDIRLAQGYLLGRPAPATQPAAGPRR